GGGELDLHGLQPQSKTRNACWTRLSRPLLRWLQRRAPAIADRRHGCDTGGPACQGPSPEKGCLVIVTRSAFLAGSAILLALTAATPACAQDLQDRPVELPPPSETPATTDPDQVQFSATTLQYDTDTEIVTSTGDVR